MTFAEYLKYTPPPGMQDELLNGDIALSPSPTRRHQDICHQLHRLLEARIRPGFVVRGDTTINLAGWDGKEGPRPDVFVIDCERWVDADQYDGYPVGSPQLVIEVKSPSNSDDELRHKAALFLADSALAVWTVDPEKEFVTAYRTMNDYQELGLGSLVELPASISIFESARISVSEIFDGIVQK